MINNFYILTFLIFFVKSFLKLFFKNVFSSSPEDFYYFIIYSSSCQEVFYIFQNFLTVYFVEIIDFVFLQDFYKFIISFIFCQELFYNFLTFNILKCSIVRLLLEKTFTILSSLSFYVNIIFKFFSFYFTLLSAMLTNPL